VPIDVVAALLAAVSYGVAAVLQTLAARRVAATTGLDPTLLLRLARRPEFVVAVVLNLAGYAMHLVALRTLPLFLVQVAIAGSVAVTAVLSGPVLGTVLDRGDRLAVAGVALGLALLTAGSGGTVAKTLEAPGRWALVAAAVAVSLAAVGAARAHGDAGAALLGVVAGLGYAVVGIGSRVLPSLAPAALATDPAAWAVLVSGVVAFLVYATALQCGEVMAATGPMVVGQTVIPSLVGLAVLADSIRSGWHVPAVIGLVLAVWGAIRLGRGAGRPGQVPAAPSRAVR
jgi:hypothetical protein